MQTLLWHNTKESIKRGCHEIVSRPLYMMFMFFAPLFGAIFMFNLLDRGMADRVPSAIVDLDNTEVSRNIAQTLGAFQTVEIKYKLNSFQEARELVQRGKINGFFYIPSDFTKKALAGRQPEISYYINYAYFVPASLLYKGFKTISVMTSASIVKTAAVDMGIPEEQVMAQLQPFPTKVHPLGNPLLNYDIYLGNSFVPGILALVAMLMTTFSISMEQKRGTSIEWLHTAGDSIEVAIFGKLFPQTVAFIGIGWVIQWMMYGFMQFPLNCNPFNMMLAMALLVLACQGFGVFVSCCIPSPRFAITVCSFTSILAFSIGGFSMPVENMYPELGILSYTIPIRYYFLIYVDQALNGFDIYYSRIWYAALLAFTIVPFILLRRLKRFSQHPVYLP